MSELVESIDHAAQSFTGRLLRPSDQGYDDLSSHGNKFAETPRLDRLARQSLEFTRFYVEPACAFEGAFCCRYSFRHHFHISLDLVQSLGPAQSFPHATIAAMFAEAGRNQIAYTA